MTRKEENSVDTVQRACRQAGIQFSSVEPLRDGVYRAKLNESLFSGARTVYIKVYSTDRRTSVRSFADIATDVGHPACRVVGTETPLLVMAPAPGRPLSQLLPVIFVPGIWRLSENKYRSAFRRIGGQLASLHDQTATNCGPIFTESEQSEGLQSTRLLDRNVSDRIVTKTQSLLEAVDDRETPYALTYGDRTPHNIYFDGAEITQIDCQCREKSITHDLATFTMGLRLMGRRLPYTPSGAVETLEESFWDGYASRYEHSQTLHESVESRYILHLLKLLDHYDSGPTALHSRLTKQFDPPIIFDEIERTVDAI